MKTIDNLLQKREDIERTLFVLVSPESVFELRILEPRRRGTAFCPKVLSGYFNRVDAALAAVDGAGFIAAKGFFVSLNPVKPDLLARAANRFHPGRDAVAAGDRDILARRWLLVDCDPKRASGISATEAEKAQALRLAETIRAELRSEGWPDPVLADSGNGYHLLYRIDLPSDDGKLVERTLHAMATRFSSTTVEVDHTVHNPSRIVKLYGTLAAKGDHCPELGRVHRMSRLLEVPSELVPVPLEKMELLAGKLPEADAPIPKVVAPRSPRQGAAKSKAWSREDMQTYLDARLAHCNPGTPVSYGGGLRWQLEICPFDPQHSDRAAAVFIASDGKLGFKCLHSGCCGRGWKELRERFSPTRKRPTAPAVEPSAFPPSVDPQGALIVLSHNGRPQINETAFAKDFLRHHPAVYDPDLGQYFCYAQDTGVWNLTTEDGIKRRLGDHFQVRLAPLGLSLAMRSARSLRDWVASTRMLAEQQGLFVRSGYTVHVANGMVEFQGGVPKLRAWRQVDWSRSRVEIDFNPEATCPRFLTELLAPTLSPDDIDLLQLIGGQCLLGVNHAQRILLMTGWAGGGKSTFARVLEGVVGSSNVAMLRMEFLLDRFELASFEDKFLLYGDDESSACLSGKNASDLKRLVGGAHLNGEKKHGNGRIQMRGNFNVILTTNSLPTVRTDKDQGAWERRLCVVEFQQPPPRRAIPHFAEILVRAEGPGILTWLIQGAARVLHQLGETGTIELSPRQARLVDVILGEPDSVGDFIRTCVKVGSAGADVTNEELCEGYADYAVANSIRRPLTGPRLSAALIARLDALHGLRPRNDIPRDQGQRRGYANIHLVQVTEHPGSGAP